MRFQSEIPFSPVSLGINVENKETAVNFKKINQPADN